MLGTLSIYLLSMIYLSIYLSRGGACPPPPPPPMIFFFFFFFFLLASSVVGHGMIIIIPLPHSENLLENFLKSEKKCSTSHSTSQLWRPPISRSIPLRSPSFSGMLELAPEPLIFHFAAGHTTKKAPRLKLRGLVRVYK